MVPAVDKENEFVQIKLTRTPRHRL
jgi:hypothetical protein